MRERESERERGGGERESIINLFSIPVELLRSFDTNRWGDI